MPYATLADAVLAVHFAVVVFVIGGLLCIPVGHRRRWAWTTAWSFRLLHAVAIAVIAAQAWLGQHCPLTHLETWLRSEAGETSGYEVTFVQYWVSKVLYFDAPLWIFATAYTAFGLLVALAWWRYPPGSLQREYRDSEPA